MKDNGKIVKILFAAIASLTLLILFVLLICAIVNSTLPFRVKYFNESGIQKYTKKAKFFIPALIVERTADKAVGKNATTSLSGTANDVSRNDDVVLELSDGYFSLTVDGKKIDSTVKKATDFAKSIKDKGIDFIYYEVPYKTDVDDPEFLKYRGQYQDYSAKHEETIRESFEKEGIDVLRFSDAYPDVLINRLKYFFKTDIHWLPQTGIMACRVLAEKLNEDYGYQMNPATFDLANYDVENVKMLGSLGLKLTTAYCDAEDFPIMIPKAETNYTVEIPSMRYSRTGKLEDTIYDRSKAESKSLYDDSKYEMYGFGNRGVVKIHNNLNNSGKCILVIKTSMANVVTPFLAQEVEDLVIVDVRSFGHGLMKFIEEVDPDTVVMLYGTRDFISPLAFNFN